MYNFASIAFHRILNWNFLTLCSFTDFFTKILLIIWLLMRVIAVDLVLHSFARHDLLIGARACVLHLIANLRAPNRQRRTKRWFLLLHVVVVVVLPTPLAWNGFRMKVLQIRHIWLYWKVASSNTSCLADFFRLLMKGFFDPYVLWPFVKKFIS